MGRDGKAMMGKAVQGAMKSRQTAMAMMRGDGRGGAVQDGGALGPGCGPCAGNI